jgi:hypothetical protein
MGRLAKAVSHAFSAGASLRRLAVFRLGLPSNSTNDFIVPALIATAARYGLALEVVASNYDQSLQDALSPDSVVNPRKE